MPAQLTDRLMISRAGVLLRATLAEVIALVTGAVDQTDPSQPQSASDDFIGGSAETGEIGSLGWSFTNGSWAKLAAIAGRPGVGRRTGVTTANTVCSFFLGNAVTDTNFLFSEFNEFTFIWKEGAGAQTDMTLQIGLFSSLGSVTPTNGAYVEIKPADSNYFAVSRAASVETRTNTGQARDTAWHKIKIRRVSATEIRVNFDAQPEVVLTTNIPAAATALNFGFQFAQTGTVARLVDVDFASYKLLAQVR
jgi:hypothetical protein